MEMLSPPCPNSIPANSTRSVTKRVRFNSPTQIPIPIQTLPQQNGSTCFQPIKPLTKEGANRIKITKEKKRRCGVNEKATTSDVLRLMDSLGLPLSASIYVSLIKECTFTTRDLNSALELHAHVNKSGLRLNVFMFNWLLLMYVSCGCLESAHQVFDEMPTRNFYSWAIMIVGYVEKMKYEEALFLFVDMLQDQENVGLPSWILVIVLKVCICLTNLEMGKQVHGWLVKMGYVNDFCLSSCLINLYGKFGCLEGVNFVFNQTLHHDTVIWTAKIVNECRGKNYDEVIDNFNRMGREGVKRNSFTFSSVLKACGRMKDGGCCGRQVHATAIKLGLESETYVQCALVDMYGRYGLLREAREVFEMAREKRNVACCNAILTSFVQNGLVIEAIKILYQMKAAGMELPESLLNEVRVACGSNTNSAVNVS